MIRPNQSRKTCKIGEGVPMWALSQKVQTWINSMDQGSPPEYIYRWNFVGFTPDQAQADNWASLQTQDLSGDGTVVAVMHISSLLEQPV